MQTYSADHLPRSQRVRLGGYYTPEILVSRVYEFIKPYSSADGKQTVIFDSAGGCGAFLSAISGYDYRIADCDREACIFLKEKFDAARVFQTNALINVRRRKYNIPSSSRLIIVGNPPYNDITSEFRNGKKGRNICDPDLRDRDLGVSFLRSYAKLKADVVCVLHPLSYLIKEANFKRLKTFREQYRLIRAEIFSSALFSGTGNSKFPIIVALYERHPEGMDFEFIRHFRFHLLERDKTFVPGEFRTTDGYIKKYPPRKNDDKTSPIGLYYYTFRDLNSLKKNTSFMTNPHPNGIIVTLENFYQYAYLYALKMLFQPADAWLYGNLSPLADVDDVEMHKSLYVAYALKTNRILQEFKRPVLKKITAYYEVSERESVKQIETMIKKRLKRLV